MSEATDRPLLTSAQWRAFYRAAHNPRRIVVGQVGMNHRQAESLVASGVWEFGRLELCKGKPVMRYRFSEAGLALLPTPSEKDKDDGR